jgi:hypothetical protein
VKRPPWNRPWKSRRKVEVWLHSSFSLDVRWGGGGWLTTSPCRFTPGKKSGVHCIGDCVGPRAGLDCCEKSCPTGIRFSNSLALGELLYRFVWGRNYTCIVTYLKWWHKICHIKKIKRWNFKKCPFRCCGFKGRQQRRRKQLLDDLKGNERMLERERGSTRSHCVANWLWNRLWIYRKTTHGMNEVIFVATKLHLQI